MARTEIAYSLDRKRRLIRLDNHPNCPFLVQRMGETRWETVSSATPYLAAAIGELESVS